MDPEMHELNLRLRDKLIGKIKANKHEDDNNNIVKSEADYAKSKGQSQIKLNMLAKKNTELYEQCRETELSMGVMKEQLEGEILSKNEKIVKFEGEISSRDEIIKQLEIEITSGKIGVAKKRQFESEISCKEVMIQQLQDKLASNKSETIKQNKIKDDQSAQTEQLLRTQIESDRLNHARTIADKDGKLKESEIKKRSALAKCAESFAVFKNASSIISMELEKFNTFNLDCTGPVDAGFEELKNMLNPNTKPIESDASKEAKVQKTIQADAKVEQLKKDKIDLENSVEHWKNKFKGIMKTAQAHQKENNRMKTQVADSEKQLAQIKIKLTTEADKVLNYERAELWQQIESLTKEQDNFADLLNKNEIGKLVAFGKQTECLTVERDHYADLSKQKEIELRQIREENDHHHQNDRDNDEEVKHLKKRIKSLEDAKMQQKTHYVEQVRVLKETNEKHKKTNAENNKPAPITTVYCRQNEVRNTKRPTGSRFGRSSDDKNSDDGESLPRKGRFSFNRSRNSSPDRRESCHVCVQYDDSEYQQFYHLSDDPI